MLCGAHVSCVRAAADRAWLNLPAVAPDLWAAGRERSGATGLFASRTVPLHARPGAHVNACAMSSQRHGPKRGRGGRMAAGLRPVTEAQRIDIHVQLDEFQRSEATGALGLDGKRRRHGRCDFQLRRADQNKNPASQSTAFLAG